MSTHQPLDLDLYIDIAVDLFEQERVAKWDDPVAGADINRTADKIAETLFSSATTLLTTVDQTEWRMVAETIDEHFGLHDELLEALQLKVAQRFFEGTLEMANRTLELLRLSLNIKPNLQVQRFLTAAARTHVLGLNAECAVMCRAAVENALGERFAGEKVQIPLNDKGQSPFALKVDRAVEYGWLTKGQGISAKAVWHRGSKSAHADPTVVTKRLETLQSTVEVLESLYSGPFQAPISE